MDIELKQEVKLKKINYDFIDSIRCLAMMGIVLEHSTYRGSYIFKDFSSNHILYISLIQLSKFGTIAFFVLAGFLLGEKFTTYTPLEYFKRRVGNTVKPWLIWSIIFLFAILIQRYIALNSNGDFHFWSEIKNNITLIYLYTNYWFIINFLICIGVLLCFKKYLYSVKLGAVLLIFSLIYSVNVYYEWFTPSHTIAIFGFVFYLWLGAYLNKNWIIISSIIKKVPYYIFIALFLVTFYWSIRDIMHLINVKSSDPYNTLRISNIAYSIVIILLLFKIEKFSFTKYLKPRETTFGLYLIHYILVINLLPEVFRPFHIQPIENMTMFNMIIFILIRFFIVYGVTHFIIYLINKTNFKWIIGR
jgi:hypothetical protein